MSNPVIHWEIQAKDRKKIQEFYGKLFGWSIDDNNPFNYGMVESQGEGGINGGIGQSEDGYSVFSGRRSAFGELCGPS